MSNATAWSYNQEIRTALNEGREYDAVKLVLKQEAELKRLATEFLDKGSRYPSADFIYCADALGVPKESEPHV